MLESIRYRFSRYADVRSLQTGANGTNNDACRRIANCNKQGLQVDARLSS